MRCLSKNAFISLIAKLDRAKSKNQIKNTDLPNISKDLNKLQDNGLKIQCHIDTSDEAINKLQGELNTLANKLKLNIGIDTKSIAKTATSKTQSDSTTNTTTVKIDKMSAQSQVDELGKILRNQLKGEADVVLKGLLEETKNILGQTTEIWTTWERNAKGALKGFSISAKQATGDLQKFNYAVGEGGKVSLLGSDGTDRGVLQKQKETLKFIDEYTSKINSLRNTSNPNLTASLNDETISFKSLFDDLEKLRNGQGSIEDVRTKFVALQSAIKDIDSLLGEKQGKGFNRFKNANITAKEFDNTLKTVRVDLDNLKGYSYSGKADNIPQVSELNKEYKSLQKTINELNSVEESQRGNKWYEDFANASEKMRQLQSDIKILNKLKKEDTSSGTKKQYEELSKIINAYREMQKLEKRRYADKTGENEINKINSLEGGYRRIINTTQERLKNTGLLTSEIKKLIDAEEKAFNKSVNYAKAQQQDRQARIKAATDEKQANDNRSRYMSEITNAYSRMNAEYSKLYNPKLSQDERNLAQQRIEWNQKIIDLNNGLLQSENLITQKNQTKLDQLKEINKQKEKEAQASANRVTTAQAETQRLSQEKKEAKELSATITAIEKGYERLATLYSGKTAPTNGTAKSDINKAESARQHSELQAQLSELTEIANANDKITKQQQEQIANAKTQYEQSVQRTNQYNQQIINEQNQTRIEKEQKAIADEIVQTYREMARLYGKVNNPNKSESARKEALYQLEQKQSLVDTLSVLQQFTAEQEKQIQKAKQGYQNYQRLKDKEDESLNVERIRTEEYNNLVQKVKQYTDILSKFNNSRQAKQNTGFAIGDDPNKRITVSQQIKDNEILLQQLNAISNTLSQSKDPKVLKDAQKELDKIISELDVAKKNSQEFTNTLTNNKIARDAERNLNTIRNLINKFGNFNPKAINSTQMFSGTSTYADEYRRIQEMANDASLAGNADKVNELTTAFKNFEQKARAAGLTSNKFFVDMGSQLKMVLNRYISLYAVIGYIRKMVENVKNLDEAMINLRRVTDETESGYIEFLEKANKQATELKVTTSELVQQTYQWSKLGYELDDALALSKASTIFSKVADITEEQSLKNLITILKAYGIEAKNVMDIVDKLDNINNKYAVDAAGLGDGLERSASALAMTGNSLEKSIAMLAGAGEITQNLENTGNALKVMSLRLQNMKGKLEELEEPVDDLMEVSKVQTQILNLTHNQVDIFDKNTKEFRSTYDIIEDIANIWDSLNSTNRASLTEILFGKNRANIGLALIQSFQSGQTQEVLQDVTHSFGVATNEYNKMMEGIEAHSNALKGAVEQLSNTIFKKETVNGFINFAKGFVELLTLIIKYTKGWGVALGVVFAYMSGKEQIWINNVFKGIAQWLGIVKTNTEGASKAFIGFKTVAQSLTSLGAGLFIGLGISVLSKFVDELITTTKELNEMRAATHDSLVDLKQNADELKETSSELDRVARSYAKVSTTVTNVTERKQQLQEIQNELVTSYQEEAEGIDLVNGKYSEQLKKLDEIKRQEEENFKVENAGRIARARAISGMNISESDLTYDVQRSGYTSESLTDAQREIFEFDTPTLPWKISDKDKNNINEIVNRIDGMYKGIGGAYYLTGDINQARDAMSQFIDQYSRLKNYNQEVLDLANEHYNMLKEEAQIIKDMQPYLNEPPKPTNDNSMFGQLYNLREGIGNDLLDSYWKPFNDKLDEAHDKLQKIANPEDLSIFEYDTIWHETQELEHTLYKMAGSSESAKNKVSDLFNQFKIGMNENGDGLDKFTENFKTALDETFKTTSEIVTTVQDAMEKLGEGKGISHTDAWKLLEEDTEGYLQTIKLVNGEYVFSEEELIRFKDAKIKNTIEEISLDRSQYEQKIKTLQVELEGYKTELKHQQEILNMKAKQGMATQADLKELNKIKITISETQDEINKFVNLWKRNNLLVEELNNNLGKTRTLSVAMETELNNTVSNLETQVKAIDDSIDKLNNRKDVLESEKKELQNQLEILNEQKKVIEEQQKSFKDAVNNYLKQYEDSLKTQLDKIKDQKEEIKDEYDKRIKALKNENEERDLAYKKEKAILDLNKAKEQQVRTYSSARGWEYGANKETVVEAQKNLQDVLNEEQISEIEKERDTKVTALEEEEKAMEHQIKEYEAYVKQYEILTEKIENADGELLAEQILGSNWRERIERKDEGLLRDYQAEYQRFTNDLERLTKTEIKNIEDSIKAKSDEIDKIGEEINAYNDFKTAVQNDLNDAKTALENYKGDVEEYCRQIGEAFYQMQDEIWRNSCDSQKWMEDLANAAERMRERLEESATGYGIVNSAWDAYLVSQSGHSHADGGVIDYTGQAQLHGTKQKSETIFNAEDSKKLYDYVHKTPDITASMIQEAVKLSGFNPSNIINSKNNTAKNNVNLTIGQVVANNPQEFTRNLDTHIDAYFRRKLTEGYVQ